MRHVWAVIAIGLLLSVLAPSQPVAAVSTFQALHSGRWDDPTTWGRTGDPVPGETIPGPDSTVLIPDNVVVTLEGQTPSVDSLFVASRGILQAASGCDVDILAEKAITIEGAVLGGYGDDTHAGGGVRLRSVTAGVVNKGLVLGGDGGRTGSPGGSVRLESLQGMVENWGTVRGGAGTRGFPGGAVFLTAKAAVWQVGEVRGGTSTQGHGGDVVLWGHSIIMSDSRVLGGEGATYGDTILRSSSGLLASGHRTRVGGNGVFFAVDGHSVVDLSGIDTAAVMARSRGLWVVGSDVSTLSLQGIRFRFPPLIVFGGMAHMRVNPDRVELAEGVTLADVVDAPLDVGAPRPLPILRLGVGYWEPLRRGASTRWTLSLTNWGIDPASVEVQATAPEGISVHVSPTHVDNLDVGQGVTLTVTLQVPLTATLTAADSLLVSAHPQGEGPIAALRLPLRWYAPDVHFPWLGYRALVHSGAFSTEQGVDTPTITLTWAGAEGGKPVIGASPLLVVTSLTDVVAADLSYWDGRRWQPVATLSDMGNLFEDGVWEVLWNPVPALKKVHLRARMWDHRGRLYQVIRQVTFEHPPYAYATASFLDDGRVLLNASGSMDYDEDIVSYHWDFGDGQTGEGESVQHTYAPGTYVVRLTVRDAAGLYDEAVYVLDTETSHWNEQVACGCDSLQVLTSGPSPLPLPWSVGDTPLLGPSVAVLTEDTLVRANVAVVAALTRGSNAAACKVVQEGRVTWSWHTERGQQTRSWHWSGQAFPLEDASVWGTMGYTRPSSLLEAYGQTIRWVMSPGWGWQWLDRGLPPSALLGEGVRLEGMYRARISGSDGSCACTWRVKIVAREGATPTVTITPDCGG